MGKTYRRKNNKWDDDDWGGSSNGNSKRNKKWKNIKRDKFFDRQKKRKEKERDFEEMITSSF